MQPRDYEMRVDRHKEVIHDEMHHDVNVLRAVAGVLFVLGFLLGALLF